MTNNKPEGIDNLKVSQDKILTEFKESVKKHQLKTKEFEDQIDAAIVLLVRNGFRVENDNHRD